MRYNFKFWIPTALSLYIYVSKDVSIRGYLAKLNGVSEHNTGGNTVLK
jgi:hypothetical protein